MTPDDGVPTAVYIYVLCAALNAANIGYDMGVSTNLATTLEECFHLDEHQKEIFEAALILGLAIGSLGNQWISDTYGRKASFIAASFGIINGLIIMIMAQEYVSLIIGRFIVGVGVGVGMSVDSLYIAEISPTASRGRLVTYSFISLCIGQLLGFSSHLLLRDCQANLRWQWMCAIGLIFPVIVILVAFFSLPESPYWLTMMEQETDAEGILRKLNPPGFDVQKKVLEIRHAVETERLTNNTLGWSSFYNPSPAVQRQLLIAMTLQVGDMCMGTEIVQYYLLDLLEAVGVTKDKTLAWLSFIFGALRVTGATIGSQMVDRHGRRYLLFPSLGALIVSFALIALSFSVPASYQTELGVGSILFFALAMSSGFVFISSMVPVEVFSICLRAKGLSLVVFAAHVADAVLLANFLSLKNAIGWTNCFIIFACVGIIVFVILYEYMPETNGKSLEEMSLYFAEVTGDYSILEAEKRRLMNEATSLKNDAEASETQLDDDFSERSRHVGMRLQLLNENSEKLVHIEEALSSRGSRRRDVD